MCGFCQAYKVTTKGKTIKRGKERDIMKRQTVTFKKNRSWTSDPNFFDDDDD